MIRKNYHLNISTKDIQAMSISFSTTMTAYKDQKTNKIICDTVDNVDDYEKICKTTQSCFEVIPYDVPVCLYGDIDCKQPYGEYVYDEKHTHIFIDYAERALRENLYVEPNFAVSISSSPDFINHKNERTMCHSIHIHITNVKMLKSHQLLFWKKINTFMNTHIDFKDWNQYVEFTSGTFFDEKVYNDVRMFRSVYSSKPKENRPLIMFKGTFKDTVVSLGDADAIVLTQEEPPVSKSKISKTLVGESNFSLKFDTPINADKILELGKIIKIEHINKYDDWCKIVWSLRSESDDYKDVAREISKRSKTKYDDSGFETAWDNYKPGQVSLGTFYHYCKTSNEKKYNAIIEKYTPKPEIKINSERDYETVKRRFEETHLLISNKSFFIRQTDTDNIVMSKAQLVTSNERISYDVVVKDEIKSKCFISDWLKDENNRMKYDMAVYPPDSKCPDSVFNIWRPFEMEKLKSWKKDENAIKMMKSHIKILCGNNQLVANYLELWIAQMIQFPSAKSICPTLISDEGAGKGTLMRLFERMLGREKILQTTKPSQYVWGNFNGQMKNAFLVNLDELSKKECEGANGYIKGLITEPRININQKGIDPYDIASYHRFINTTNVEDPIKTSKTDRRNLIIRASDELIGNRDYFDKMYSMLKNDDAVKSIYEYFKSLPDADKFCDLPIPETEYQKDIKEVYTSPIELWLRHLTEENIKLDYVEKSSMEQYDSFNMFKADCGIQFECSIVSFSLKLKNLKVDGVGEVVHTKNGNKRIFDIPKMKKHFGFGCLL